jgi:hypothetical protein
MTDLFAAGPKPIIFLDVDGVLNTSCILIGDYEADDLFTPNDAPSSLKIDKDQSPLKRSLLKNLRWLVDSIDAHIVVTSTWRGYPTMLSFLIAAAESEGISPARFIGTTPWQNSSGTLDGRGAEIRSWLASNPAHAGQPFVVFDDQHVESFEAAALTPRVVVTLMNSDIDETDQGLTVACARRALDLLTAGSAAATNQSIPAPSTPQTAGEVSAESVSPSDDEAPRSASTM